MPDKIPALFVAGFRAGLVAGVAGFIRQEDIDRELRRGYREWAAHARIQHALNRLIGLTHACERRDRCTLPITCRLAGPRRRVMRVLHAHGYSAALLQKISP